MDNKEKVKLKIRALLLKTTENGCTEEEMAHAMAKASELMEKYYVNHNDLNDPFLGEKCEFGRVDIVKMQYKVNYFYPYLSRLFDCEHYFNKNQITFFGFSQDVELCKYFYEMIMRTLKKEIEGYKKGAQYKVYTEFHGVHAKKLINSFSKGFVFRVCEKMSDMYQERKASRTTETGLVVISKIKKVRDAFNEKGLKINNIKNKPATVHKQFYEDGQKAGDKVSLTQGIKTQEQAKRSLIGEEVNNG